MDKILTIDERRALKAKFDFWHKKRVESATSKYDLDYYELVEELIESIVQLNDENYDNSIRLHNEKMNLIKENHFLKLELQEYQNLQNHTDNFDRNRVREIFFNPSTRLPRPYRT
jgi:hypothetical protein